MLAAAALTTDRLAIDVADAQALKAKATSGDRAALVGAAKQFESLLVSQMLKNMRQARFSDEDDPMNSGEGFKLYQDLLDQQWATQLSKGRGLGFADMMVKALERMPTVPATSTPQAVAEVTANAEVATNAEVAKNAGAGTNAATNSAYAFSLPPASFASATTSPRLVAPVSVATSTADFLDRLRPHAEAAAAATGVPAHFILGQAALESGWGKHEIKDADGNPSHNLFGIKAGASWEGAVAETLTTEYRQGVPMKLSQRFRAYDDYQSAFTDYANLLKSRYGNALQSGADAAGFAKGLANGGYATDPAYADKLQAVIAKVALAH